MKKIVLAYSGGLDTSVAIQWLKETYGSEIVAFCADLGQGEDLNEVRDKALKTGASKVYVEDLREEFVSEYVFPMLRAGALYEGVYLLGTSITPATEPPITITFTCRRTGSRERSSWTDIPPLPACGV